MKILDYFKQSFRRKRARRITSEYPAKITSFHLEREEKVDFANWENPLVNPITITQQMVDFFKKFIQPGDLVIDIGANIGDTTVPMALAAGAGGITLGFDPNPYVYKILEVNASLNKDKLTIIPLQYAITVEEEEFFFISSEASFSNGGISPVKESKHGKFIYPGKIKGINLKCFLEKNYADKINKLSFIKIDTEGYDKEIIKSISALISQYKPVIVAESFKKASDEEKMELFDVIEKHGYVIFYFEDFDIDAKVTPINNRNEILNWSKTINIYAKPR